MIFENFYFCIFVGYRETMPVKFGLIDFIFQPLVKMLIAKRHTGLDTNQALDMNQKTLVLIANHYQSGYWGLL